jgi:hypothetical protein
MAAFTEGSTDLLRNTEIFSLNSHPVEADGMAALPEICQFFFMALPTFFRKDHGLLFGSYLVIDMAGHTMDTLLRMFRFRPRLE